jgi:hypothetical protein
MKTWRNKMNNRSRLTWTTLIVVTVLLIGCASQPTSIVEAPMPAEPALDIAREGDDAETVAAAVTPAAPVDQPPGATPVPTVAADGSHANGYSLTTLPDRPHRLIVKNAELELLVAETDVAIDLTTQIAADCAGYIISSRVWYEEWQEESYKHATITLGVPVDQFERAMRRLRGLALQVIDETASGQDVTDEYVDLQSRLGNLEATRDRIREFLDQAQSVEESLRINAELTIVEEQIEQVEGRMNYLFDRAAYSTITAQIKPDLPPIIPAPTPTPIPTPTPTPPWSPTQTVERAGHTLGSILRVVTEIAIWVIIVVVPLLAPPLLVVWAVQRWVKARREPGVERQTP